MKLINKKFKETKTQEIETNKANINSSKNIKLG
jgi:hypothetical protein